MSPDGFCKTPSTPVEAQLTPRKVKSQHREREVACSLPHSAPAVTVQDVDAETAPAGSRGPSARGCQSVHLPSRRPVAPQSTSGAIGMSASSPPLEDEEAKAWGRAAAGDHPRGEEAAQLCGARPHRQEAAQLCTGPFSTDRSSPWAARWLIVCVHDASENQKTGQVVCGGEGMGGGAGGGSRAHAGQREVEAPSSSLHSGCDPTHTARRGGGRGRPFGAPGRWAGREAGLPTPAEPCAPASAHGSPVRSLWPALKHPLYFSITQSQLKI